MDGWLLAGLLFLFLGLSSCLGGGLLDTATRAANIAGTTAIAAHDEIRSLCMEGVESAANREDANNIIIACGEAEGAYTLFRSAWLTLAQAIRVAETTGEQPADLQKMLDDVTDSARNLSNSMLRIRQLVHP